MLHALQICGPAAAGVAIGWFIAFRTGAPLRCDVSRSAWSILGLAVPYLLLVIVIAGVGAAIAALLGTLAGAAVYSGFILRLSTAARGG